MDPIQATLIEDTWSMKKGDHLLVISFTAPFVVGETTYEGTLFCIHTKSKKFAVLPMSKVEIERSSIHLLIQKSNSHENKS